MTPCSQSRKEAAGPTPLLEPRKTKDRPKRKTDLARTTDNEQCLVCKKYYLKGRGIKIHQKKAGCYLKLDQHRKLNKSEAAVIQENNHRDDSSRDDPEKTQAPANATTGGNEKAEERREESRKEKKVETALQEEMTIQVEENIYNDVQDWVEETKESKKQTEKKGENRKKYRKKKRKSKEGSRSGDIRNWLKDFPKQHTEDKTVSKDEENEENVGNVQRRGSLKSVIGKIMMKKQDITPEEKVEEHTRRVIVEDKRQEADERKVEDIRNWLGKSQSQGEKKNEPKEEDTRVVIEETPSQEDKILKGQSKEVLSKHGLHLSRGDYRSLIGRNYLNDKIIDQYLQILQRRSEEETSLPRVHACTTFLYTQLKTFGLEEGCRRTERWTPENLLEKDQIFFPIHHGHHWSLVMVEPENRAVHYFDSLHGSRHKSAAPGMMKRYMETQHKKKGVEAEYSIKIREDAPLQYNGVDCGVFVCQYAERMTRRSRMDFTQRDMTEARKKMIGELLEGKISSDWGRHRIQSQLEKDKDSSSKKPKARREKVQKEKRSCKTEPKKSDGGEKCSTKEEEADRKKRIDWPQANSREWERLDADLTEILRVQSSTPENKSVVHPVLIYTLCLERFGEKKGKGKAKNSGPSKRQAKCKRLREEINTLKETYFKAKEEEKDAVRQLQDEKIRELRLAKRAEAVRKRRRKFAKNCNDFLSHPFDFARNVIAPKPRGTLESSKEEVEQHLKAAHGRKEGPEEKQMPEDTETEKQEQPEFEYDDTPPTWHQFNRILRKTRNKSSPGPNGVPYLVYKRCPGVARQLYSYLKGMWRKNIISRTWRKAEGIFIPKVENAKEVGKFRTISLLNVEGKLFFALKAERMTEYCMKNKFIDSSIQKGGVPGVSGCMEHTAILSQLIKEAKEGKKDLVVVWLDIANAYGTIPHSMIMQSLRKAHVPEEVCELVESYYSDVAIRFTTRNFTTEWQKVEQGIITGCTLSVILFALAMTLLVASCKKETKGPKTETGQRQENSRLFMDDIATTTETLVQTKHLLENMSGKLDGAGLSLRLDKCRSLVIVKGEVSNKKPCIKGTPIVSVSDAPVKYLGKVYTRSLSDREQAEDTLEELQRSLRKIERCQVPGRYKAWMVQHMILPRIMWPLTIYRIPETKIREMQGKITAKLKKWLGLPKTLSVECLYTKSGKLQLPFSELSEEVKASKARVLMTYMESTDPCIQNAGIEVDGGRKANTAESIKTAKEKLRMEEIVGIANRGREGLGLTPKRYFSKCKNTQERRGMVVEKVRETEEDRRRVRMTGLSKQGGHMRWEVPERKISTRDIVCMPEDRLKFLIKAVYDLLPTPQNKNTWYGDSEECNLCGECGSLSHILSGCKVALAQGRYKWRHDEVLREVAAVVDVRRRTNNALPKERKEAPIKFVRQGEKISKTEQRAPSSYLDGASDWVLSVDLEGRLKVPSKVAETSLRPDMLLLSDSAKRVGIIELTVPSEDRVEISGELKRAKYSELEREGRRKGWVVRIWTLEVGCRGFPAASTAAFLKDIGLGGGERTRSLRKIGETAERCSKAIWSWSCIPGWGKG